MYSKLMWRPRLVLHFDPLGSRSPSLKKGKWFPGKYSSEEWDIVIELDVQEAYMNTPVGIATGPPGVKVKVTVTRNRKIVSGH
jgi:hypothetical protein